VEDFPKISRAEEAEIVANVEELAGKARHAALMLAMASNADRSRALNEAAAEMEKRSAGIFEANARDVERSKSEGLASPLLKRLRFDEKKMAVVCDGLRQLARMPDPLGKTLYACRMDEGLMLRRVTCPIGVIGVIFESRPDALVQISGLCLKSGNAVLLKGGSEAALTNAALFDAIYSASLACGLPEGWAGLMETRQDVAQMLKLDELIDLVIPRGSNAFVRHIMDNTRIPVMGHAEGICHVYVDASADADMAVKVALDSKMQGVATCNAAETLLVHRDAARSFLPRMKEAFDAAGVEMRGCPETLGIIGGKPASDEDWDTEYLDYIISVKVVDSLDGAIAHINRHGSRHTDAIVTADDGAAARFMLMVDAAGVFRNCSTRFADGYNYGLGAEVGISTGKLHARGPVGLEGLLSYKYLLDGSGQTMAEYAGGGKRFLHEKTI
jgi:glutamate-5-semialdehyde dehydrogenase